MSPTRGIAVRYRVLALLFVLSFVNYLLRNSLSVAVPGIRAEFGFTSTELGWILGSFNLSYTLLMIPGGILGERLGPRRALAIIAVTWGLLTAFTGFAPTLFAASATGAMVSLITVRLLVGASNAPIFPLVAGTVERWFPPGSWAFPNAVSNAGLSLGQAAIGPLVTALIVLFGWRASFYVLAPLGVLGGAWWFWYVRDRPEDHPAVAHEEARLIGEGRAPVARIAPGGWRRVLVKPDVLLLSASYFCMNVVFYMFSQWLFTYLVEARRLSVLESGWLYVLPFATGAALALVGGRVCDVLCRRLGARQGCRLTAMPGLVLVALFMVAGAFAADPYAAVALLSLCFGFTLFTDSAFWAAATYAAGPHTTSATGVLNFGGNVAGLLAPAVGFLIDSAGWLVTIAGGSVFALAGAALWLGVRLKEADP